MPVEDIRVIDSFLTLTSQSIERLAHMQTALSLPCKPETAVAGASEGSAAASSSVAATVPRAVMLKPYDRDRDPHARLARMVRQRVQRLCKTSAGWRNGLKSPPQWIRSTAAVQRILAAACWRSRFSCTRRGLTIVPWPGTSLAEWTAETSLVLTTAEAKGLRACGGVGKREEWSTHDDHHCVA
jgi:hypothetical protein